MSQGRRWWRWGVVVAALLLGVAFGEDVKAGLAKAWDAVAGSDEEDAAGDEGQWYTCGMHPWVILPKDGDCPICHMALTPIDPDKFTGEITIPPVVVQNIGVRVAPVEKGALTREIRTVGTVAYDETRVRDVNLKVEGWIEAIHVDYLGAPVEKGAPLFELYSPALYAAQEEYLQALRRARGGSDVARDLLESARTRLEFFGISDAQIEAIAARREPAKTLTIRSPFGGLVVEKHANEGMKVTPGMQVYRIADLTEVWVMVTLYEYQLPFVGVGQEATMSLPYIPGQTFEGRVTYIYPTLDEKTREVRARVEFDNPELLLKPGMFATIRIHSTLAEDRVLVPREAVIDTGERQVAFVSLGEGRFEPRDVRVGPEGGNGRLAILDGLRPGEMVVVSGQFLIDSESRIREALAKMMKGELASEQRPVVAVAGASDLTSLPEGMGAALGALLDAYFAIGDTLASDSADGIADPARTIAAQVDALVDIEVPDEPHFWHEHTEAATIRGKALEIVAVGGEDALMDARLKFADLSVALSELLKATGVPPGWVERTGKPVQELHCPMYREGQGGSIWLQPEGPVRNPFYGSQMLECFDERRTLPVTGQQASDDAATDGSAAESAAGAAAPGDHAGHDMAAMDEGAVTDDDDAAAADGPVAAELVPQDEVDRLFASYLALQEMLAKDSVDGAAKELGDVREAALALKTAGAPGVAALGGTIGDAATFDAADLEGVRAEFHDLSKAVIALAKLAPPRAAVADPLRLAWCPMVKAHWLQRSEIVDNPYYGSQMLTCGEIQDTVAPRSTP